MRYLSQPTLAIPQLLMIGVTATATGEELTIDRDEIDEPLVQSRRGRRCAVGRSFAAVPAATTIAMPGHCSISGSAMLEVRPSAP